MTQVLLFLIAITLRFLVSYEVLNNKFLVIKVLGKELGRVLISEIMELKDSSVFEMGNLDVANLSNKCGFVPLVFVKTKNTDFLHKFLISPNKYEREVLIRLFQSNFSVFNK